ncbi:MAG: amidase [Allosphingosinicella sp.]|uniref:amidase n=1 Tax=Allosphingosinicella sp. TaxID=2823234 RepID=UPI0039609418
MIDFDALEAANRPLNAFLDWDRDAKAGEGPLAGLTVGVKANIAVEGLPWTAGMALHRGRIAPADAEVVGRLREAGAAIVGTLNMEEAALGTVTANPWFGSTRNPHDLARTAGGSSGGSAAAVAAGLCDVALGTDTMGSIRIPAAFCCVYGFKPAEGAVSQEGLELCEPGFDAIGPLTRSLDLLERAARVMGRFGEGEASGCATLAGLGGVACDPEVLSAYQAAVDAIQPGGAVTLTHPLSRIRFAGFIAAARSLAEALREADPALLSEHLRHLIGYGAGRAEDKWVADRDILATTRAEVREAVERHGLLLLPTAPHLPHLLGEAPPADQADFTCLANIAGLPALSLPAGWSADGLPAAVQLVGLPGAEAGLFAAARRLDAALGAYRPPPDQGERR